MLRSDVVDEGVAALGGEDPRVVAADCPVRSRRRKASTSNDALPGMRAGDLGSSRCGRGSMSCNVVLKGFRCGGPGWAGDSPAGSSSSRNGPRAASRRVPNGDCLSTGLSDSDSESDERGGGVWTRTRFTGFVFRSAGLGAGAAAAAAGIAWDAVEAVGGDGVRVRVVVGAGVVFAGLPPFLLNGLFVFRRSADMVLDRRKPGLSRGCWRQLVC